MPITLGSTRALRGEKRKWTLVVTSHGRWKYLARGIESVAGLPFDRAVVSFDGCMSGIGGAKLPLFPGLPFPVEILSTGPARQGLTANMAQAIGALTPEDEWVFWLEEDFVVHDAPLDEMADALEAFPNVANMVLVRQPWNEAEVRAGSVLRCQKWPLQDRGGWLEHENGYWLNPMVTHASLLRTLQPGVEESLTRQCRSRGLTFGYWGDVNDPPRCEHIGAEGGMGSSGWKP